MIKGTIEIGILIYQMWHYFYRRDSRYHIINIFWKVKYLRKWGKLQNKNIHWNAQDIIICGRFVPELNSYLVNIVSDSQGTDIKRKLMWHNLTWNSFVFLLCKWLWIITSLFIAFCALLKGEITHTYIITVYLFVKVTKWLLSSTPF